LLYYEDGWIWDIDWKFSFHVMGALLTIELFLFLLVGVGGYLYFTAFTFQIVRNFDLYLTPCLCSLQLLWSITCFMFGTLLNSKVNWYISYPFLAFASFWALNEETRCVAYCCRGVAVNWVDVRCRDHEKLFWKEGLWRKRPQVGGTICIKFLFR